MNIIKIDLSAHILIYMFALISFYTNDWIYYNIIYPGYRCHPFAFDCQTRKFAKKLKWRFLIEIMDFYN